MLTLERVAHHCAVPATVIENVVLPTTDGQHRAPALHWGQPRTMAILAALCAFGFSPTGFRNRDIRPRVAALHDPGPRGYTAARASYDLRRLVRKGLIQRVAHSQRYVLTQLGRRVAFFMTKSYARVVRPVLHRLDPSLPPDACDNLRRAWNECERALNSALSAAKMAA